jgi:Flp pilus assembly protein TadD
MLKALLFAGFILAGGPSSGPSDEMYDDLRNAPNEREAGIAEQDIYVSWMESSSPTVDILMERAIDAQTHGRTDLARALYDRAILIEPDYAEAWNRRATLFLSEENYAEALRDVNEVLRIEPRHFGAWTGLGAILERLGSREEALDAYREALKFHPHLQQAKQGAARLEGSTEGNAL